MTAVMVALSVGLGTLAVHRRVIDAGAYLGAEPGPGSGATLTSLPLRGAAYGLVAGVAAAVAMEPGLVLPLGALGAAAGALSERAVASTARERDATRLIHELPTVADTLALYVLAGDSIATALERLTTECNGVAVSELERARLHPDGLEAGLNAIASQTAQRGAARLYDLLAHAHTTGGRLAESLSELAFDFRATLTERMTTEGGRRALASYGPILGFMIPVTLVFLMYPTLSSFSALSSSP